ncbi:MAG: ATP-binding cassette domain-containing protein, partial [Lachnospiraceae bacterium]|nr:ATP-binding cassette domain-containing protein [Lachnospiraceae bacterium]
MERNGMTIPAAIKLNGYEKHFDGFNLGPLEFEIPAGFTTALIGENGAGKTTLLDALGGITSGRGKITWLEKYTDLDQNDGEPRNEIGWCAGNRFFPMTWSLKNIRKSLPLAFDNFD